MDKLLSTKELSEYLGLSRMTLSRWRSEGLPFIKIGKQVRFKLDDVMKWIEQNKKGE